MLDTMDTTTDEVVDVTDDLDDGLEALAEAEPDYDKAETYFLGEADEKFLSPAIRKLLSGSENDFRINLAGRVVGALLDRLQIGALTAEENTVEGEALDEEPLDEDDAAQVLEADGPEESEATRVLNEVVWHANDMDLEAPELHEKTESLGDGYLFIWPRLDDQGKTVGVDVHVNSPKTVRVLYDEENPRVKRVVIKRWKVGKRVRVNLYYPGEPGYLVKRISKVGMPGDKAEQFEVFVDDHTDEDGVVEFPWVFDELPFFHFRTGGRPYGRPAHVQAYGAQDAITKLTNGMMTAADFSIFPQRYGILDPEASTDDDQDFGDEDDVDPEEMMSQLTAGSGRVWLLKYVKQMGQFATTDIRQFLDPLDWFREVMAAITGTPIQYLRQTTGQREQASGESQKESKAGFTSKVAAHQLSLAASWREAGGFALRLLGFDATVTVRWQPPEIISTKEEWEAVKAKQDAGVPVRQSLLEVGYTEPEVTSWGFSEEQPDGPSIDFSQFASPPPVPGVQAPAALTAPEPPGGEG